MKVTIRITRNFKVELKPLLKKYPSILTDLIKLENDLMENPRKGNSLGKDAFKIRLKISSKGKGKSSGARIITLVGSTGEYLTNLSYSDETTVNLLSIYDKSDLGNISDKELKDLIKRFYNQSK